jgi:hypothetical protein
MLAFLLFKKPFVSRPFQGSCVLYLGRLRAAADIHSVGLCVAVYFTRRGDSVVCVICIFESECVAAPAATAAFVVAMSGAGAGCAVGQAGACGIGKRGQAPGGARIAKIVCVKLLHLNSCCEKLIGSFALSGAVDVVDIGRGSHRGEDRHDGNDDHQFHETKAPWRRALKRRPE